MRLEQREQTRSAISSATYGPHGNIQPSSSMRKSEILVHSKTFLA